MARALPAKAWRRVTWARGSEGPLEGRFARVRVRVVRKGRATDETGWLLLEDRGGTVKAYLCWGLDGLSLKRLVAVAHGRWAIEQSYQQMKEELGLDHFEGRTWKGWYHHTVLVQLAYALLMELRSKARRAEATGQAYPLPTLPEVRRAIVDRLERRLVQALRDAPPGKLRETPAMLLIDLLLTAGVSK